MPVGKLQEFSLFLLQDSKDELADLDLDRVGSDIEEGGLDLSLPFKPIMAYIGNKREMLEQCFRVLGEKKLQKMLPDELKVSRPAAVDLQSVVLVLEVKPRVKP